MTERCLVQWRASVANYKCRNIRSVFILALVFFIYYIYVYSASDNVVFYGENNMLLKSHNVFLKSAVNVTVALPIISKALEETKIDKRKRYLNTYTGKFPTERIVQNLSKKSLIQSGFLPIKSNNNNVIDKKEQRNKNITTTILKWPSFDSDRRVWSPWSSGKCQRYTVHFTLGALPCALASYPGSGNTWTRYLLEAVTGVHTGSIYADDQLYLNGYRGELEAWKGGTTLLQKVHEYTSQHIKDFNNTGVLLLRNPYRAVLSYHNFLFGGHKGYAPVSHYRRADWDPFLHVQIKGWLLTAVSWIREAKELTVVHYEQLTMDPESSLRRVLTFMGLRTNDARMDCIKSASSDHFKRVEEHLPHDVTLFSAGMRSKFDRAIRYVDTLVRGRGLAPLPLDLYEFYNGTGSDQVVRVPCLRLESVQECDYRVDLMNKRRRYNTGSPPNLSTSPSTLIISPPVSTGVGRKWESAGSPSGVEQVQENTRLTLLERLNQNQMVSRMSDVFLSFVQQYTPDPVQALMRSPQINNFLAAPVPLEGLSEEEAQKIVHDYVWKARIKPEPNKENDITTTLDVNWVP